MIKKFRVLNKNETKEGLFKFFGSFLLTVRDLLISLEIGSMKCPNRGDAATANQLLCLRPLL